MDNLKIPGGILIGIPFSRNLCPQWVIALLTQNYPIATNMTYKFTYGVEIGDARQEMAEYALEIGAKYLYMMDDDTAPPAFAARKLIYELEQHDDAMVCAGIYCTKEDPPYPIVFQEQGQGAYWDWLVGDVFECQGIGTGCMMVKTEVFTKLEKPWFKTVDEEPKGDREFRRQMTDDLYFCEKVRAAGYKILAHGGVHAVHYDPKTHRAYTLPAGSKPMREWEQAQKEGISLTDWKNKQRAEAQQELANAGD